MCYAFITETVDCGDDFVYKQVGSNLSGRVSRGALGCGRSELPQDFGFAVRTPVLQAPHITSSRTDMCQPSNNGGTRWAD